MENRKTSIIARTIDKTMEIIQFEHAEFYGINGFVDIFTKENRIMAFGIQNENGEYDLLEAYFATKGKIGKITTENADEINFISQLVTVIDADTAEDIQDKEMMLESVRDEFKDAATVVLDNMLGESPKKAR